MTDADVSRLRAADPAEFDRLAAERLHGLLPPAGLDEREGVRGLYRDGPGSAWWFERRWPERYSADAGADHASLRVVKDWRWSLDRVDFSIELFHLWRTRGAAAAFNYEPGDYTEAALRVLAKRGRLP